MPTGPPLWRTESTVEGPHDLFVGNTLLSNTTACEASRLLKPINGFERPFHYHDAFRACDLISLIDSAVLHERIFYLPASLPTDIAELELRNRLVESGVLALLPSGDDHNAVGKALLGALSTVEGLRRVDDDTALPFDSVRPKLMDELRLTANKDRSKPSHLDPGHEDEGLVEVAAESFDEAARQLIGWLDYGSSGAYEGGINSLRNMYYIFASEHYALPYLPSMQVGVVQRRFPNYFQPSVRERLYQQLASALGATVDAIAEEFDGPIVFVPPFSALVLNRAATPAEIPSETLALRAEYSNFRRKMCEMERGRLEARSLNDRMKALRQIEQLGKAVVRPFDQPSQVKLEPALRYIPDAIELATNPTNPAGWARVLLGLPTEALLSWYRRRPVAKLIRAGRAVGALHNYDRLLTKHFGESVASRIWEIQSEHQGT